MLTKRRLLIAIVLVAVTGVLCGPLNALKCRVAGEPFYRGKPASYWSRELRHWGVHRVSGRDSIGNELMGVNWFRDVPAWAEWTIENAPCLERLVAMGIPKHQTPFLGAGEEASSVLLVLLEDTDPNVRRIAAFVLGQSRIGGQPALVALCKRLNDADTSVREEALVAIQSMQGCSADEMQSCICP